MNRSHTRDQEVRMVDPTNDKRYFMYAEILEQEGHVIVDYRALWEVWPNGKKKMLIKNHKEAQKIFYNCLAYLIEVAGEQARSRREDVESYGQPTRVRDFRGRRLPA